MPNIVVGAGAVAARLGAPIRAPAPPRATREIACIVRGTRATTVVVAVARPADWTRLAPQLQRAVASFSS